MPELASLLAQAPPPLPHAGSPPLKDHLAEPPPLPSINQDSAAQIRPWPRYWARMIDGGIAGLLLGTILELAGFPAKDMNGMVLGIIAVFAWIPVEGLFLSTWGFTPGKWLLKIRITDGSGSQLDFQRALTRSVRVWTAGLALGIPIATMFTNWYQYDKLKKTGKTTYDRKGELIVHHQYIGGGRLILVVLVCAGFVALIAQGTNA